MIRKTSRATRTARAVANTGPLTSRAASNSTAASCGTATIRKRRASNEASSRPRISCASTALKSSAVKTKSRKTEHDRKRQYTSEDSFTFGRLFCPVCFCDLLKPGTDVQTTYCGHIFCHKCILQVMQQEVPNCPTCRANVSNYHTVFFPVYEED